MTTTPGRRWSALWALTAACTLAHAAVLRVGTLSEGTRRTAEQPVRAAVQVRLIEPPGVATPSTPFVLPPDVAVPHLRTFPSAGVASSTRSPGTEAQRSEDEGAIAAGLPEPAHAGHLPTGALDMGPMPRSSPDERFVEHVARSGLPIRLRLFIEADGVVSSAAIVSMAPGDEDAALQVAAMFRDTAFAPGRLAGRDVAAFMDVEIVLEPSLPAVIPLAHY